MDEMIGWRKLFWEFFGVCPGGCSHERIKSGFPEVHANIPQVASIRFRFLLASALQEHDNNFVFSLINLFTKVVPPK